MLSVEMLPARVVRPPVMTVSALIRVVLPIEQIQKFLGHSKLETTQVYAESTTEMIKESYRKALAQ